VRRILSALILLLPYCAFGQAKTDEYAVYSSYFRVFNERGGKHTFAVKVSADYNNYEDVSYISEILNDFRDYVRTRKVGSVASPEEYSFISTLKTDTLWLPLISELVRGIHRPHPIKNLFSKDLQVFVLPYNEYSRYYGATNSVDIAQEWAAFHENYPDRAVLVDLSEVVSDGRRAVFYFGWRCGGLCGDGSLVMLSNDGSGWRVVTSITMWYN